MSGVAKVRRLHASDFLHLLPFVLPCVDILMEVLILLDQRGMLVLDGAELEVLSLQRQDLLCQDYQG